MKTVGILGGGQLGGMLSEALYNYGAKVIFYDPDPLSPSFQKSARHFQGEWHDEEQLLHFFNQCDVVTYEFENVATDLLSSLVRNTKTKLFPSEHVLAITQNRIQEKNFLQQNGFPVCRFKECYQLNDLLQNAKDFVFPYIIKTAFGGYDGKGQWVITSFSDFEESIKEISKYPFLPFIIEEKLDIIFEASCIVARNLEQESICLPIFDNIHKNQILFQTHVPSILSIQVQNKLKEIAVKAANALNVTGLLTTEFFITKNKALNTQSESIIDGYNIYINEFAPRPHNSGHISRNACNISQYDLLARVLLELPLHTPELYPGNFCMQNLLGDTWINQGQEKNLNLRIWKNHPHVTSVTFYGKEQAKEKRKMGHFICHANSRELCSIYANNFSEELNELCKY